MKMKIKKIFSLFFYFLLLILLFQTRLIICPNFFKGIYVEYLSFSLYFTDLLILFLGFGLLINKFNKIKFNSFLFWLLGCWELLVVVSIFNSLDWKISLFHYLWFVVFLLFFYLLIFYKQKKENIYICFLAGSFVQACLAIWQFLSQKTFSNKYLGIASHFAGNLGQSVIENDSGRWLRAYGSLDHPNILGAIMGVAVILSIYLLFSKFKKMRDNANIWKIIFLIVVFVVSNFALLFSFSRLAIFATYLSLFIIFIYFLFKKRYLKISLTLILSSLLVIFTFCNLFGFLIFSRLDFDNRLEEKSLNERKEQYIEANKVIENNGFFGTGFGNYFLALEKVKNDQDTYSLQPVHNSFLLLRSELGILGFLIICIYFIYLFFNTLVNKNILGFSLTVFLFIILIAEHWVFSLHFGWIFFALITSFIFMESKKENILFSS
jgi:O-antigen ligase